MARKKRDYKAEYARRRTRSKALGYSSPREEYRARKSVGLTRVFPSLRRNELPDFAIERLTSRTPTPRTEAKAWSDRHSHIDATKFTRGMPPEQFKMYYEAFIQDYKSLGPSRRKRAKEKRRRIGRYMKKYHPDAIEGGEETWKSKRETVA